MVLAITVTDLLIYSIKQLLHRPLDDKKTLHLEFNRMIKYMMT
jgi:hypothetical protein